jgi:pSer/pThr/pTyr-binding forkhead associated (FHA) protein
VITLGRDKTNTVVINDQKVSRLHARIELRKDKFVLIDQSTNGTFVLRENGHIVNVRRFEFLLPDAGAIGLGQEITPDSSSAIRFRMAESADEKQTALNLTSDEN